MSIKSNIAKEKYIVKEIRTNKVLDYSREWTPMLNYIEHTDNAIRSSYEDAEELIELQGLELAEEYNRCELFFTIQKIYIYNQ